LDSECLIVGLLSGCYGSREMKEEVKVYRKEWSTPRSRISEGQVDELLKFAAEVFVEHGYEGASVG